MHCNCECRMGETTKPLPHPILQNHGIFIFTLDSSHHQMDLAKQSLSTPPSSSVQSSDMEPLPLFPHLTCHSLAQFTRWNGLTTISCLQMTQSTLFFAWPTIYLPHRPETSKSVESSRGSSSTNTSEQREENGPTPDGDNEDSEEGGSDAEAIEVGDDSDSDDEPWNAAPGVNMFVDLADRGEPLCL